MIDTRMSEQELAMNVHDAFDRMSPSDDARARVLASIQGAQDSEPHRPTQKSLRLWWIALPLAACLVLAVVIVQMQAPTHAADSEAPAASKADVTEEMEAAEETEAVPEMDAVGETYFDEPARMVTLEDGTTYEVGDPLDKEPAYSHLEEAEVDGRPCVVADRTYVRFEDEDVWYELLTPAGR